MFKRLLISKRHSRVRDGFLFLLSNTFLILSSIIILEMILVGLSIKGVTLAFPSSFLPLLRKICFF